MPVVASIADYSPTTGNVHLYLSDTHSMQQVILPPLHLIAVSTPLAHVQNKRPSEPVVLIDIEGSNSPSLPRYVLETV